LAAQASDIKNIERDVFIQEHLLSIPYVKRRQNINDPGIGECDLERLSGYPPTLPPGPTRTHAPSWCNALAW